METFIVIFLCCWLLFNFVVFLWVLYTKLEGYEKALSKCSFVEINRKIWRGDRIGRMYRLNFIRLVLGNPSLFHRRGDIDLDQVLAFPRSQFCFLRAIYLSLSMQAVALGIWCLIETYW